MARPLPKSRLRRILLELLILFVVIVTGIFSIVYLGNWRERLERYRLESITKLMNEKKYAQVASVTSAWLARNPENKRTRVRLYNYRGWARLCLGRNHAALDDFSLVVELDPECPDAWRGMGVVRKRWGDLDQAAEILTRAIAIDPRCDSLYEARADVYWKLKRKEEAYQDYSRADSMGTTRAASHYRLGLLLEERGESEKAAEQYQEAKAGNYDFKESRSAK